MGTLPRCTQHLGATQLDQEELKAAPAQQIYSLDDHGQGLYLRTNQIKQICGLITYMKHAYQVPSPQDSTMTLERSINLHFTYHIAQAHKLNMAHW